jgi:hypothetical protein
MARTFSRAAGDAQLPPVSARPGVAEHVERPVLVCARCGRSQRRGEPEWVPQWADALELEFHCPDCAEPEPE